MKIFLIGMMGSGKSSVGLILSQKLNYTFYDLDKEIEVYFGMPVSDIFNKFGREDFRAAEEKMLIKINEIDNVVISTGGGIIETPENRAILKNSSTFYLNGDMQEIYERAAKRRSERPLMENMDYDGFLKLFEERDRMYKECSKQEITIDNKDIAEIANEIINYERN
jgi:shikimate kinase